MNRLLALAALLTLGAASAIASTDPVADTRQIMAGTVTTKSTKNAYLSGSRDTTAAFQGALAAYKAVRAAEVVSVPIPAPAPSPPPSPTPSVVAYDASIGSGVDADGFSMLPLRQGAHRYFVRNGGNDANGCLKAQSPATPLATLDAGVTCLAAGQGDQLLLAEGSVFNESIPQAGDPHGWLAAFSGYSAAYPTVFSSYDPADPLNELKYGRGDQRGARPILRRPTHQVGNGTYGFIAVKGLDFNPGNIGDVGIVFVGHASYILFENNILRYTGLSFDTGEPPTIFPTTPKIIIRNNSVYGVWASNTDWHTGGVYVAGFAGVTVEDNVFYHNGWNIAISRAETNPSVGIPTVFNHSYYLQTNTTGAIIRRNLSADGAGDGGIARGDSTFTENLFIDNPAAIGVGGGPSYNLDRPSGVKFDVSYNAIIGDADVSSQHLLGWGISTSNGVQGSRVHHNLIVRSRDMNAPEQGGFSNNAPFPQPSYAQYDHNLIWKWVSQANQPNSFWAGCTSQWCLATYDSNNWDGAPLGTNTNSAGTVFPNPYTAQQLYVALGFADKAAFIDYVINHPEAHIQRQARLSLFQGYGMN